MKMNLQIDAMPHWIDTTDPELLAKWIIEQFARVPEITPATLIEVMVQPSWVYSDGKWVPDWETNAAITGRLMRARSPRELVEELSKQLDEAEALRS